MASWMDAAAAARLLQVTRATLYAYVSRGRVRSQAMPGHSRERLYSREDVERLRQRSEHRRDPGQAAAQALQWGLPVLESAITLIDGNRLYYRGHDAIGLARSRPLAGVAALIWLGSLERPLPAATPPRPPRIDPALPFVARAQTALTVAASRDRHGFDLRPPRVAATGWAILNLLASAAAPRAAAAPTVDQTLARAWRAGSDGAAIIRAALILCADHELNVSSFTARCVASAGADPYAAVIAGLAALQGPRHGGAGARVESMLGALRPARLSRLAAALADRLRRGEPVEGFGHPLYPDGDPRALALLELLREHRGNSSELRFVRACADAAAAAIGDKPNLDFALAAVTRVLRLPPGSPLTLFAIGRSIGWIGQAMEQYAIGQLIRPRAKYVGVAPALE